MKYQLVTAGSPNDPGPSRPQAQSPAADGTANGANANVQENSTTRLTPSVRIRNSAGLPREQALMAARLGRENWRWSDALIESRSVSPTAVLVAWSLLKWIGRDDGIAWPAVETIAARIGKSPQRVRIALHELERMGFLIIVPRQGMSNMIALAVPGDIGGAFGSDGEGLPDPIVPPSRIRESNLPTELPNRTSVSLSTSDGEREPAPVEKAFSHSEEGQEPHPEPSRLAPQAKDRCARGWIERAPPRREGPPDPILKPLQQDEQCAWAEIERTIARVLGSPYLPPRNPHRDKAAEDRAFRAHMDRRRMIKAALQPRHDELVAAALAGTLRESDVAFALHEVGLTAERVAA